MDVLNNSRKKRKNSKKLLEVRVVGSTENQTALDEETESSVCCDCIEDEFLKKIIRESSKYSKCFECESTTNPVIGLEELGHLIHKVLEKYFYLTSDEPEGYEYYLDKEGLWDREGEEILPLIEYISGVSESIAGEIVEILSACYDDSGKAAFCNTQRYSFDPYYAENKPGDVEFSERWHSFKVSVGREARFFNEHAKKILDHIFDGVSDEFTENQEPVLRSITTDTDFYRSRVAKSLRELEIILTELPASIGPPGEGFRGAGRMNAHGISVFYGALDKETCLAEVRAPVGAQVVTGVFNPLRELRILDLSRFESIGTENGSYFDEKYMKNIGRQLFLKSLTAELSEPIMPGDENEKYLATQVVADYLSTSLSLKLDGLIFNSSQIHPEKLTGRKDVGKNIVLFYDASRLSDQSYPKRKEFNLDMSDGYDKDNLSITLYERKISNDKVEMEGFMDLDIEDLLHTKVGAEGAVGLINPSIKLNMDSVEVDDVKGVVVSTKSRRFKRVEKSNNDSDF